MSVFQVVSDPDRVRLIGHLCLAAGYLLARKSDGAAKQPHAYSTEWKALESIRRMWNLDRSYYSGLARADADAQAELRCAARALKPSERNAVFASAAWVANADGQEVGAELDALCRVREALSIPPRVARAIHRFARLTRRTLRRPPSEREIEALVLATRRGAPGVDAVQGASDT